MYQNPYRVGKVGSGSDRKNVGGSAEMHAEMGLN